MSTKRLVQVFIAALFIIAKSWKLLKYPTRKAGINSYSKMNESQNDYILRITLNKIYSSSKNGSVVLKTKVNFFYQIL